MSGILEVLHQLPVAGAAEMLGGRVKIWYIDTNDVMYSKFLSCI